MALTVALMCVLGATACSATKSDSATETPSSIVDPSHASAVVISSSEYRRAFHRFEKCANHAGADLIVTGTEHGVIQYAFASEDASAVDRCYAADFEAIDVRWQQQLVER